MNPEPSQQRDDELGELVFAYLERVDAGATPEAALRATLAGHHIRENDLRASLHTLRATGLLEAPAIARTPFPERVAGYRLRRQLGCGGMGVVFLAEDEARELVALKLVRPEQLYFERARARFRREVESARRLDHPGIAAVLDSGEEAGLPFIAQSWIPGASLDELLDRLRARAPEELTGADLSRALQTSLPEEARVREVRDARARGPDAEGSTFAGDWEQTALRLVLQVARALEHAHARRVLHRDVKPSNIVVTPDGRAVLVDFGLAWIPEASRLTRTGAQPGSLPYMSPEQLAGSLDEVDARADVYSLGVTLYELLTLRRPFRSQSSERVRALILAANPTLPQRLNSLVRGATQTVCLAAMDRDPRRRYPSALAFARDLEHVLAGRSIEARPPGLTLRSARWARREPLRAALLTLLVVGPLSWAAVTQWAMLRVQAAYQSEQEARTRADRQLTLTLAGIRSLIAELADGSLSQTPQLQRTRLEAIERALEVLGELERERPDERSVQAERGHLARLRGDVLGDLGRSQEARASYAAQVLIFQRLLSGASAGERLEYQRELSLGMERGAALLCVEGSVLAALEPHAEAVEQLRLVARESPPSSGARAQLALGLVLQADLLSQAGELGAARGTVEEGLELTKALLLESPDSPDALANLARARSSRLSVLQALGRPVDTREEREQVVELLRRASELRPEDRRIQESLALETGRLAGVLASAGEQARALELSEAASEGVRQLARLFPEVERYSELLLERLADHALVLAQSQHPEQGGALIEEQAEAAERLFRLQPGQLRAAERAARMLNNLAAYRIHVLERPESALEALRHAELALAAAEAIEAGAPARRELGLLLAYNRALAELLLDRRERGESAIEVFEQRAAQAADEARSRLFAADLWAEWVQCLRRTSPPAPRLEARGRELCLERLEAALAAGFDELQTLRRSEVFGAVVGDDPRWSAMLEELSRRAKD